MFICLKLQGALRRSETAVHVTLWLLFFWRNSQPGGKYGLLNITVGLVCAYQPWLDCSFVLAQSASGGPHWQVLFSGEHCQGAGAAFWEAWELGFFLFSKVIITWRVAENLQHGISAHLNNI